MHHLCATLKQDDENVAVCDANDAAMTERMHPDTVLCLYCSFVARTDV